ncbi:DUF4240 domain-containing protein [Kitasatospora cinereorecta]|uniref:DUF4240 domain-containing protein n=1 Tax=Kitasatospora cinereorecta TaxID=285560 RepID=A0ABW0V629_9ACTN
MDEAGFWGLIEESRVGAASVRMRSQRLIGLLERLPEQDVVDFQRHKDRLLRRADTVELLAAHHLLTGGRGGGDAYFYFLHWLIGLGRPTYERVTDRPDALVDVPQLPRPVGDRHGWPDELWPDWEDLISIAARAHATVAGVEFGGWIDVRDITGSLSDPDTRGDPWDLDDRRELAQRLPRLYQEALPHLDGWPN